ncbi:MAG: aminotransferase class I/II-fold pyridoxal phosphate-dependent enzyme [Spirochaetales bacterium]|nr:aminotransferase class I/II-fold pyridoxal phosphate-dependent enzyme [Spirochaetales bacterium]
MKPYDLRSDTLTLPCSGMRKAIVKADVGDDVYGEDPTVNRLEELTAKITGKRDALFVTSGSMGNLIPLYINGGRGNEVLTHELSHILHYELDSAATIAGVTPVPVPGKRGILEPRFLEEKLRPDFYYMPRVSMVSVENTHNMAGGTCYTQMELKGVADFARKNGLKVHLDGARVFNAAIATEITVRKICSFVDTITFCLSKGLGAPVGSMLCGDTKFIAEARRIRKMLGGGMRQAGIIAAAGIYALENNVERLAEDHQNAGDIAKALQEVTWAGVDPKEVETNIIIFRTEKHPAKVIVEALKKQGIHCSPKGQKSVRMVTNLGISKQDITEICGIIRKLSL